MIGANNVDAKTLADEVRRSSFTAVKKWKVVSYKKPGHTLVFPTQCMVSRWAWEKPSLPASPQQILGPTNSISIGIGFGGESTASVAVHALFHSDFSQRYDLPVNVDTPHKN